MTLMICVCITFAPPAKYAPYPFIFLSPPLPLQLQPSLHLTLPAGFAVEVTQVSILHAFVFPLQVSAIAIGTCLAPFALAHALQAVSDFHLVSVVFLPLVVPFPFPVTLIVAHSITRSICILLCLLQLILSRLKFSNFFSAKHCFSLQFFFLS